MHQATLQKIDEIASIVLNAHPKREIGLYTGNAGISLFLFYYARYRNAMEIHRHATDIMEDLFKQNSSVFVKRNSQGGNLFDFLPVFQIDNSDTEQYLQLFYIDFLTINV